MRNVLPLALLALMLTSSSVRAQEETPPAYAEQREQVEAVAEQTKVVAEQTSALICYLKDKRAIDLKECDIPDGWVQPVLDVYDVEGATCSQIPARKASELIARAAIEADIVAVQAAWTVEEIWNNKGGPPPVLPE